MTRILLMAAALLGLALAMTWLALPAKPLPIGLSMGGQSTGGQSTGGPGALSATQSEPVPSTREGTGAAAGLSATSSTASVLIQVRATEAKAPLSELIVLVAATMKRPADEVLAAFTAQTGIRVSAIYGGSAQLLPNLRQGQGDVFLSADSAHVRMEHARGQVREIFTVARQHPVVAVAKGNPKRITSLDDMVARGLRYALPNPESAGLGSVLRRKTPALWATLAASAAVMKPTVPDLWNDVKIGTVDAAIVWDAGVFQQPDLLEAVADARLAALSDDILLAISASSAHPAAALQLARFLASPEHGAPTWSRYGYQAIPGDAWSPRQRLLLFSGSVNRAAIVNALRQFAEREGTDIDAVYNGCGILCADIRSNVAVNGPMIPDAYYACDVCFVPPVAALFPEAVILSETDIGIAVPKGNPKQLRTLVDLALPQVRLALGNAEQATLGYMTSKLIESVGLRKRIMANAVYQGPTGDLLVQQLRIGLVDAAIVYEINVKHLAEHIDFIKINHPGAKAVQPFAVRKGSAVRQTALRLLDFLRLHQADFAKAGFRWRGDDLTIYDSASFSADPSATTALRAATAPHVLR